MKTAVAIGVCLLLAASASPQLRAQPASPSVRTALEGCLGLNAAAGETSLTNYTDQASGETATAIFCTGDRAQRLYEAVAPYQTEDHKWHSDDNRIYHLRDFGEGQNNYSECNRLVRDAAGIPATGYHCFIVLDLNDRIAGAI